MTISYLVIWVKDMNTSLALYKDILGLEINQRYPNENGGEVVFLVEKGCTPMVDQPLLELIEDPMHQEKGCGFIMGFEVESLAATSLCMEEKGIQKVKGPYSPASGVTISTFVGPDGEIFEVMEME